VVGPTFAEPMKDFYTGYEGYPEVHFTLNFGGSPIERIATWDGFFASVMANAVPLDGRWCGLALPYHTFQGWLACDGAWRIPDLHEALRAWKLIPREGLDDVALDLYSAIAELLTKATTLENASVWIEEF
jgi:hypothetical protein